LSREVLEMSKLKELTDRITLETGKAVPNPKIVLFTILIVSGFILGASKAYSHFQVAHIINEAKILSAGEKYEEAVGVLLLAKDRWATNSLKKEVVSEIEKNRELASVKSEETSKKDTPTTPSLPTSAPPPTSSNAISRQTVASDDPVIDCTSERCGTKRLRTTDCSKAVCCEINGEWVWTYSSTECKAEQSKYQKIDYSYQISWLRSLIDGANEYIDEAAPRLKREAEDYYNWCMGLFEDGYNDCMRTWEEMEQDYPEGDYEQNKEKCSQNLENGKKQCKTYSDQQIQAIDIDIAGFKYRKAQYEYLLKRFEAGNPNQADFDLYNEIVTEGR